MRFVDRFRFLSGIYEGIIDKSKVHSREGIVSFTETDHGVTVRTDQGNTYEGSILVGADGVHSETRRQLSLGSKEEDPKRSEILSKGFVTRCKSHPYSFQYYEFPNCDSRGDDGSFSQDKELPRAVESDTFLDP